MQENINLTVVGAFFATAFLLNYVYWRDVPTWLTMKVMVRYMPDDHPLKVRHVTYKEWHTHSTPVNAAFGVLLWLQVMGLALLIFRIFN